ncbi:MAG TPA: ABC transporter permease [Bryobacteraceae bacterium]|nr:ABC transporter permease [Bryobacteraceae bacterium]
MGALGGGNRPRHAAGLIVRLRLPWRSRRASESDPDIDAELRYHLEMLGEEREGRPDSGTYAHRKLGNATLIREEIYYMNHGFLLESIGQDLVYAARTMRKNPLFTATAVAALALGIGANTAIFSVVHAVLLNSLPYREPERIVKVWGQLTHDSLPQLPFSDPEFFDLADTNRAFDSVAAYYSGFGANLGGDDATPVRITRGFSTASLFPLLGVKPILGRPYSPEEDQPGHSQVAMLSFPLWRSLYAGDRNIAGKTIRLNGRPFTIIGVLPEGFDFAGDNQVWTPLGLDRANPSNRGNHNWQVIARLKPGATLAEAQTDLHAFADRLLKQFPNNYGPNLGWGVFAVPLREELVAKIRPALLILMAAVGFVLLIACANIANLLLVRASAREKEISIRTALGAGRWRTVRQLLTESLLLALVGSGAGLALGAWGLFAIRGMSAGILPHVGKIELDAAVLWFTFAIALFTGILFGLAPAVRLTHPSLLGAIQESARGSSGGRGGQRLRNVLVVAEIAFSLMLVTGAGLAIRGFRELLRVDPGFRTDHILTMRMSLPAVTYPQGPRVARFYDQVLNRIRTLPGVVTAGAISILPMGKSSSSGSVSVENSNSQSLQHVPNFAYGYLETDQRFITPGYLETMKTPLVAGRSFTSADTSNSPGVAIVDSKFAATIWPGQNPLGQRISISNVPNSNPPRPVWCTVVGVVAHVHNFALDQEGRVQAYFPDTQDPFDGSRAMTVTIRTSSDPESLISAARQQVLAVDRSEPVFDVLTMDAVVAGSLEQPRLSLSLLSLFAAVAGILAAIGVYGVMAFGVSQRRRELGIRMALGARPGDMWRMVIGDGLRLGLLGIVLGLAGAFSLTRFMAPLLFGVGTHDPVTFTIVPLALLTVALLASWIPALRAGRVEPIGVLRQE